MRRKKIKYTCTFKFFAGYHSETNKIEPDIYDKLHGCILKILTLIYRSNKDFLADTEVDLEETDDDHDHTERDDYT
jgi:hypothetical protein